MKTDRRRGTRWSADIPRSVLSRGPAILTAGARVEHHHAVVVHEAEPVVTRPSSSPASGQRHARALFVRHADVVVFWLSFAPPSGAASTGTRLLRSTPPRRCCCGAALQAAGTDPARVALDGFDPRPPPHSGAGARAACRRPAAPAPGADRHAGPAGQADRRARAPESPEHRVPGLTLAEIARVVRRPSVLRRRN